MLFFDIFFYCFLSSLPFSCLAEFKRWLTSHFKRKEARVWEQWDSGVGTDGTIQLWGSTSITSAHPTAQGHQKKSIFTMQTFLKRAAKGANISLANDYEDKYIGKSKRSHTERKIHSPRHHKIAGGRAEIKIYTNLNARNCEFNLTVNTVVCMPYITQPLVFICMTEASTTEYFTALAFALLIFHGFLAKYRHVQRLILPNNKVLHLLPCDYWPKPRQFSFSGWQGSVKMSNKPHIYLFFFYLSRDSKVNSGWLPVQHNPLEVPALFWGKTSSENAT